MTLPTDEEVKKRLAELLDGDMLPPLKGVGFLLHRYSFWNNSTSVNFRMPYGISV